MKKFFKEFLIGLLFLLAVILIGVVGVLLAPFFLVVAFFLRIILVALFVMLAIWLLGKVIVETWKYLAAKKDDRFPK